MLNFLLFFFKIKTKIKVYKHTQKSLTVKRNSCKISAENHKCKRRNIFKNAVSEKSQLHQMTQK